MSGSDEECVIRFIAQCTRGEDTRDALSLPCRDLCAVHS